MGVVTLAAAREEARAVGLTSWDIFQGNVRIERHDPGVRDSLVAHLDVTPKQAKAIANETGDPVGIPKKAEAGDNLAIIGPAAAE